MNEHEARAEALLPCYTPNVCGLILDGTDYRCTNCLNRPAVAAALEEAAGERYECPKCLFASNRNAPCPNDGEELRVTNWKKEAIALQAEVTALTKKNEWLDAKLTKLARHHENEVAAARVEGLREALGMCGGWTNGAEKIRELIAALERGKTE